MTDEKRPRCDTPSGIGRHVKGGAGKPTKPLEIKKQQPPNKNKKDK